jgi:hypothetical protein
VQDILHLNCQLKKSVVIMDHTLSANSGNGKKRKIEDTSSNNGSPIMSKAEKVGGVLFYNVGCYGDEEKIKTRIREYFKDCKIKEVKITANNNAIIYPGRNVDKEVIMDDNECFPDTKKLDLGSVDKRPCLVVKKLSYEIASANYAELRSEYNIKAIEEMKSKKSDNQLNMVKCYFDNETDKKLVLRNKCLYIDLIRYYVDDFSRPPMQCHRCKHFGHMEKDCKNKLACQKCSEEHKVEDCFAEMAKCYNCGKEHSCYYRGCEAYKAADYEIKSKRRISFDQNQPTNNSQDSTTRIYSAAVTGADIDAKFISFGKSLTESLQASMDHALNEFNTKLKESLVSSFTQGISKNNEKVCYFTVDAIKACMPAFTFNSNNVKAISESFKRLSLGQIDQNVLTSYCTKLNAK